MLYNVYNFWLSMLRASVELKNKPPKSCYFNSHFPHVSQTPDIWNPLTNSLTLLYDPNSPPVYFQQLDGCIRTLCFLPSTSDGTTQSLITFGTNFTGGCFLESGFKTVFSIQDVYHSALGISNCRKQALKVLEWAATTLAKPMMSCGTDER